MLTGYDHDEVIGKNCRFLQEPYTDENSLNLIRKAIRDEEVLVVEVMNYREDGTKFWNALHLGPIYDGDTGELLYFSARNGTSRTSMPRAQTSIRQSCWRVSFPTA